MYEDLVRIPLIVRPPGGLGAAHRAARVASLVDLVPTIVRMCGGQPDDVLQGMDCSDLALGGDTKVNEGVVAEFHSVNWIDPLHSLRMWVDERWKYVESQDDSDELYDLQDDPLELHNQVRNPACREQVERSRRAFHRWCEATGASWPEVVPPPRPATLARPIV